MPDEPPKPEPPPGWYDDPEVPGGKRYWDGSKWTDQRRSPERLDEPPPPEPPPPEPPKPVAGAGWYDDPKVPGGERYWDGSKWTDQRRPSESKGALRRWYSSLSRGVQWLVAVVVGAGAVAGAIGAILALVPGPTPPLRANLSQVRVGSKLTLTEWAEHKAAETAAVLSGPTASRLAANVMVQAGDETTSVGGATPPNGQQGQIVQPTPLRAEDVKALNDGLDRALSNPAASLTEVGSACLSGVANPECGLRSTADYLLKAHSPSTPESVENHFLTLFDGMRIAPAVGQPVGVPVDVHFSLTGLSGHTATISWTLYRRRGLADVPEDWVRGERVLRVSGGSGQPASAEFWVPIPIDAGPYYVKVSVSDEDGTRLDSEEGKPEFGGYSGTPVPADKVDGFQFVPITDANAFMVYAPEWTHAVTERSPQGGPSNGGPSLTALVNPDETMMVQVQRVPEHPLKAVADQAHKEREAEGATVSTYKPTAIAGRDAYLLRYSHDEPTNPNLPELPDLGHVFSSVYLFNDSGFTWRVRAAVKTSVADGENIAWDLARKMAETFEPNP